MKPKHLCPHCYRVLDLSKVIDRGDFWIVICDFCNREVIKAKPRLN